MTFCELLTEQTSNHSDQTARSNSVSIEQGLAELFGKGTNLGHFQNTSAWINSDVICIAANQSHFRVAGDHRYAPR